MTAVNHTIVREWIAARRRMAIATEGSAPLEAGSTMLIDDSGTVGDSLAREADEVLAGGGPRVRTYRISDEEVIARQNERSGDSLPDTEGPIHPCRELG
jgi:xanthine/CO dehydrogenase XdhC/CoxF family maturation factor